jgi:acetoin utilization deacetylase AcuC-like enzyme
MDRRETFIFSHPSCFDHQVELEHPEKPSRLDVVLEALDHAPYAEIVIKRLAPSVDWKDLTAVHPSAHVSAVINAIPTQGFWNLEADTVVSPGSKEAALHAAGAACAAIEAVIAGNANAFCAVRPPGHHAGASNVSGFCIFNNVAVAAFAARRRFGLRKIAIVDFDVHHGDGTQSLIWAEPDFLYASLHQHRLYPGTGAVSETGSHNNILNIPLDAGDGSAAFRAAVRDKLLPRLDAFAPELLLVSAGFDAHRSDPLGGLCLEVNDFAWIGEQLQTLADHHCQGRLVAVLEGGYNLEMLGPSVAAFVGSLIEDARVRG